MQHSKIVITVKNNLHLTNKFTLLTVDTGIVPVSKAHLRSRRIKLIRKSR